MVPGPTGGLQTAPDGSRHGQQPLGLDLLTLMLLTLSDAVNPREALRLPCPAALGAEHVQAAPGPPFQLLSRALCLSSPCLAPTETWVTSREGAGAGEAPLFASRALGACCPATAPSLSGAGARWPLSLSPHAGASPAGARAKSGPNPAVAGRVAGPEMQPLSAFVKCGNRREGRGWNKERPGVRAAGFPGPAGVPGPSAHPLCKVLPRQRPVGLRLFSVLFSKVISIESAELFLRVV